MDDLKKLIDWAFFSLIPLTALSFVLGVLSDSLTVITVSIDSGLSLIVNFFAFYSIRIILRKNVFIFPYGTGKLENFSSFLYGTLMIPTSLFILYFAVIRFLYPPAHISLGLTQASSIPQFARSLVLFIWSLKLLKRHGDDSPMARSYYINFKVTLFSDISIILGFVIAFILNKVGHQEIAFMIDAAFSGLIGVYMLYHGFHLLVANFKSLINLPLPEEDQLKIMQVLTKNFDKYENIGNLYTNRSGKTRFIEIELYLKENANVAMIAELSEILRDDLKQHFGDVRFTLIPLEFRLDSPTTGDVSF